MMVTVGKREMMKEVEAVAEEEDKKVKEAVSLLR
jgi:hypothetical protein